MSSIYTFPLSYPEPGATTIYKNIQVGSNIVQFRFQWAIASEEQYNIIMQYLDTKTKSDPLNDDGAFTYDYNYMSYYMPLAGKTEEELGEWLDTNPVLPNSIKTASRSSQLAMLQNRIAECVSLHPTIKQYRETLRWQFHSFFNNETNVGLIELGGWYRTQDPLLRYRFVSPLTYIGKDDFDKVTIEFEVDNA